MSAHSASSLPRRALREAARLLPERAVQPFSRPSAVFFHGTETSIDDAQLQNRHHLRDTFISIIRALKARYDVLPLSALNDVLKDPQKHKSAVFLMADDGYANMSQTADLLEEFALPWTLFISTHHIDTRERNPMFRTRLFMRYAPADQYLLPHLGKVDLLEQSREDEERRVIAALKLLETKCAADVLTAMDQALGAAGLRDLADLFPSDSFLRWEDVRNLAARGVTIGAHAHWHWPMNTHQPFEHLAEQAALPRQRIASEVGACTTFSYPFGTIGDISRQAWRAVRDAGYDCAFTTHPGTLDASTNRFLLPRYGIGRSETHLAAIIPMLRGANYRLRRWQAELR